MPITDTVQCQTRSEIRRDAWICQSNIAHFTDLLAVIVDDNHRATLLELIAEQQAKLADLQGKHLRQPTDEERPRNWENPHA